MNPDSVWLDVRWGATGLWLGLFGLALALTLRALWRPCSRRFHGVARAAWAGAMVAFVGMWVAGAALELMRRVWSAPLAQLLIAMALFALLIAGVVALMREWFVRPEPPATSEWRFDARRVAWTMSVLCGIGWSLGGLALWPFETTAFRHGEGLPVNWLLAWSGAQLAGAMQLVSCPPAPAQILNPRPATGWLLIFALVVGWFDPLAAGAAGGGFAAFLACAWALRDETARLPLALRRMGSLLPPTVLAGVLWWQREDAASWLARQQLGLVPLWWGAGAAFGLWLLLMASGGRLAFALAIHENAGARALAWGAGAGALAAWGVFGAAGALFWSFWPLATLFFALLEWHDNSQRPARRLRRGADAEIAVPVDGGSPEKR